MSEHWGVFLVDFLYIVQDYLQSERSQRAVSVFFFWVTVDCEHAWGASGEARETTGGIHTLYKPAHYATSRTQHCWLTTPNIVGCYIHVAFVSTPCCMLLRVVAQSLKPATTCKRTQQHPTMLPPFARALVLYFIFRTYYFLLFQNLGRRGPVLWCFCLWQTEIVKGYGTWRKTCGKDPNSSVWNVSRLFSLPRGGKKNKRKFHGMTW